MAEAGSPTLERTAPNGDSVTDRHDLDRLRERLHAYGIAPPSPSATAECPLCGSTDTVEVSRFGATPCKAQWRCNACLEPFERFKCH